MAECQLPKLNVAGSIPVTRSILILASILLLFHSSSAASTDIYHDFWLEASGYAVLDNSDQASSMDEATLLVQLKNGNRKALLPLVNILVASGRIEDAEIWMEARGEIPVTRRDLGIALSWYGRFELYNILHIDLPIPQDLEDDDYSQTLAAILYMGWMNSSQDGCFYPDLFAGPSELDLIAGSFFPSSFHWERDWIGIKSLDSLFAAGTMERTGNEN